MARRTEFDCYVRQIMQAGVYGQRLGRPLYLREAPSHITRSLHSAELAVTETRNDDPVCDLSGPFPSEDAYLVSLKLRDYPDCECWELFGSRNVASSCR